MKTNTLKKIALALLMGVGTAQANFLTDLAMGTAGFFGSIGFAIACSLPASGPSAAIIQSAQEKKYESATKQYGISLAIGGGLLVASSLIEGDKSGIALKFCKQALHETGKNFISMPTMFAIQQVITGPMSYAIDQRYYIKAAVQYLASVGAGFTVLNYSKALSGSNPARYILQGSSLITTPTIAIIQKLLNTKDQGISIMASLLISHLIAQ